MGHRMGKSRCLMMKTTICSRSEAGGGGGTTGPPALSNAKVGALGSAVLSLTVSDDDPSFSEDGGCRGGMF